MTVTLIDYGAGNVTSVARAFRRLGAEVLLTNKSEQIASATSLVLPGVGHCAALLNSLDADGLREPLLSAIKRGAQFLGICLGLQALYERSEEAPGVPGLRLLRGEVQRLPQTVKLPHMGWNQIRSVGLCALLQDVPADSYFYFAHSYAAPAGGPETIATCAHGNGFTAVLNCRNVYGVQFHPEKSGAPGEKLLENFLRLSA